MARMSNESYVGEAIRTLRAGLGPFVDGHMSRSRWGGNWIEALAPRLKPPTKTASLNDTRFLLRVINDRWNEVFSHQFLRSEQAGIRNLVNTLRNDSNTWAHTETIADVTAQHVISGVVRLLTAADAGEATRAEQLLRDFNRHSQGAMHRRSQTVGSVPHAWFTVDSPLGLAYVAHHDGKVSALRLARHGSLASKPETGLRASDWGVVDNNGFVDYLREVLGVDAEQRANLHRDPELATRVGEALATGRTDVHVDLSSLATAPFQRECLMAATQIPRGEVRTYKEVAHMAGNPSAQQTAGNAMKRNPVPLLIPCHRVVDENSLKKQDVGKWGYGHVMKYRLLASEGVVLSRF